MARLIRKAVYEDLRRFMDKHFSVREYTETTPKGKTRQVRMYIGINETLNLIKYSDGRYSIQIMPYDGRLEK